MENLFKLNWTKEAAEKLLNNGFKLFHVFASGGFAYVFSRDLPAVPGSLLINEIPSKFACDPRIYSCDLWLNGHFWYMFANENDKDII